jgi:hypothetical protein
MNDATQPTIDLTLTPDEIVAVVRSMDRQPPSEVPPGGEGFWTFQTKLKQAMDANPVAAAAINSALDKTPAG